MVAMTVGIAAICQESGIPKVVFAADRMITTGGNPQIEYEHTRSKIKTIHDNGAVSCMGIASGTVSFIESFFDRLDEKLDERDPVDITDITDKARESYTELGRDTVQHRVLNQFDIGLSSLANGNTDLDSEIVASILSDISDAQSDFANQLEVLIGGIDGCGAHLYSVQGFDLDPHNTIRYHAVGSGTQPARSVFIRNEYDSNCGTKEGLLNIVEAKYRSEEARGVGTDMDLAVVRSPNEAEKCCEVLDPDRRKEWTELYEDIVTAEKSARDEIIKTDDLEYGDGE